MSVVYDCSKRETRADGLAAAAGAVRSSRLVVLPTDTVYGIGADAFDAGAVQALLRAKNRGPDMPVGVLVGSWSTVDGLVLGVPPQARALIEAFWPGDLSIVLPHAPSLQWNLGDARGTVMLRMPLHPVALALLSAKNRGPDMPVGVLVGSWSTVDGLVLGVPPQARALIEAFWPGDLSIVLPHAPSLQWNLGDARGTVMLRMPLHPVALELL